MGMDWSSIVQGQPSSDELEQRKQGWGQWFQKLQEDPALRQSLMFTGAMLMRGRQPGQSTGGLLGQAAFGGMGMYNAMQRQQTTDQQEKDKTALEQQKLQSSLKTQELQNQVTQAELANNQRVYQGAAYVDPTGRLGAEQKMREGALKEIESRQRLELIKKQLAALDKAGVTGLEQNEYGDVSGVLTKGNQAFRIRQIAPMGPQMAQKRAEEEALAAGLSKPGMFSFGDTNKAWEDFVKPRMEQLQKGVNERVPFGEELGSEIGAAAAPPSGPFVGQPQTQPQTQSPMAPQSGEKSVYQAVQQVESGGDPNAVSPKGATGNMQLMPGTAKGLGVNARVPLENIAGGVSYLDSLFQKYGDQETGLMAYNWGPGNVDAWIKRGKNPAEIPPETRKYLQKVSEVMGKPIKSQASATSYGDAQAPIDVEDLRKKQTQQVAAAPKAETPKGAMGKGGNFEIQSHEVSVGRGGKTHRYSVKGDPEKKMFDFEGGAKWRAEELRRGVVK